MSLWPDHIEKERENPKEWRKLCELALDIGYRTIQLIKDGKHPQATTQEEIDYWIEQLECEIDEILEEYIEVDIKIRSLK